MENPWTPASATPTLGGVIKRAPSLSLLLLVSLLALPALAFDALRTTGGRVVHAPRTPWPVYVQADPIDKLSVAKVQAVTLAAIGAWNAVSETRVQLSYGGLVREPPQLGVYLWLDRQFAWPNTDGTARTDAAWDADGGLQQATIVLNGVDFQWITGNNKAPGDARPGADLQSVLTHQLGHALGLTHTHDPAATMYFWGTSRAGRTLNADDARSLRFVYPANDVTASATCDPCRSDADCAGAGRCLAWPDGFAYCAAPCTTHEDCPIGTGCGGYSNGIACLPLDGHCNADRASDHFGDPCASDLACQDATWCMPVASGQGFCTTTCAGGNDMSCPGNGVCDASGSLCVQVGDAPDGTVCRVPGDCYSADCRASSLRSGTCGQDCAGKCPKGEVCADDGNCRVDCSTGKPCPEGMACANDQLCRGPMNVGWPCGSGYDCATGTCVTLPGLRFDSLCSKSCSVPADCPAGTGCAHTGQGDLCIPGAALTVGSPCATNASCGKGLGCDFSRIYAGLGTCATACDPFAQGASCAVGWCSWAGDASNAAGLCRSGGGSNVQGQGCVTDGNCRSDLVCAQGAGNPVCSRNCDPATPVCDTGLSCIALAGTSARGVCMDGGTVAQELPAVGVKAPVNLDARVVMLPNVVPVAEFLPPPPPPQAKAGCSATRTAANPGGATALLLAFGVWCLRRLERRS